ncbi:MAG: GNAT family N-acetyltransferase [Planctomycetota bacterium]
MITVLRIDPAHELYPAACRLREEVLLRGAGFTFDEYAAAYPYEDESEHFIAVRELGTGGRHVVGTALMKADYKEPGSAKVSQVAVDPQLRGEGIGRKLMIAAEARGFGELGQGELFCHAQDTAVAFYRALGWRVVSDEFEEAGIRHFRMAITSAERAPEAT